MYNNNYCFPVLDINECSANNGECSQTCSNTNGSFVCSCMIGYTLSADNLTCNGKHGYVNLIHLT